MKSAAAIAVLFALAVAAKPVEQRQISITAQYYESSDCSGASVGSQSFSTGCAELNGGQYPGLIVTFSDASPFLTQYYTDGDCKGQDLQVTSGQCVDNSGGQYQGLQFEGGNN